MTEHPNGSKPFFEPLNVFARSLKRGAQEFIADPIGESTRLISEQIRGTTFLERITSPLNPLSPLALVANPRAGLEQGMGFLSSIGKFLGGAVKAVGTAFGVIAPKVAPIARRAAVPLAAAGAGVLGGALAFGGGGAAAGAGLAGVPGGIINPATGEFVGAGGGNGVFTTITTVTTFNRLTGQAVKQRMFQGRPFLMQKEVAHLSSTARKLMRGARKVPSRTRAPSLNAEIISAVKHDVLHKVQQATLTGHAAKA